MMLGNPLLLSDDGGYQISRSVRLRKSASAYFSRTPGAASNQQKWTWSGWVKLGDLSTMYLMSAGSATSAWGYIGIAANALYFTNSAGANGVQSAALRRDPSAWYHIVFSVDTTQATAANRVMMYVNGVAETSFQLTTGYPAQNANTYWNGTSAHALGRLFDGATGYYTDGYLTEINFIDGQALTPASFGQNDPVTGVWQPKKYAGTYGTNGFYLNFKDPSSTTTIGYDYSGNANNWTSSGVSVTAGVTYDSMVDVPTMGALGSNYAVLNALFNSGGTLVDGNLRHQVSASSTNQARYSTFPTTTGKMYFEARFNALSGTFAGTFGVTNSPRPDGNSPSDYTTGWAIKFDTANVYKRYNSTDTLIYSGMATTSNTFMFALDPVAGNLWLGRDGAWVGSGDPAAGTTPTFTGLTGDLFAFVHGYLISGSYESVVNFGQRPFAYTPPTGFLALNTQNLPDSTIKAGNKHMDTTLYSGDGSTSRSITGLSFTPDFLWLKQRSSPVVNHYLVDSVRGATGAVMNTLFSSQTSAEQTTTSSTDLTFGVIKSIDTNGFTVGTGATSASAVNTNGSAYVGWQWKAGGAAVTNNAGSISSQVSANVTAGFSIVTLTGNAVAGATVGHGLGVKPAMIIMKSRGRGGASDHWWIYHKMLNGGVTPANYGIHLDLTNAQAASNLYWNNTEPTSSVFTLSGTDPYNTSGVTYVAYCFSEVPGFSKFGSYTGNGSADGPFVYCGFRPKFVMIKNASDGTATWLMWDSARDTYNVERNQLYPNQSAAEVVDTTNNTLDFLSNGFKYRGASTVGNGSGNTIIFAAFAESPFKNSLAR